MHPSFTYTSTGANQAELTITNSLNPLCNSTMQQTISLASVCQLGAGFGHTVGSNGLVYFSNLSINTTSNTQYFWNFGDGWTTTLKNPQHRYQNGGTHYVKQVAMHAAHCKDSTLQAINVTGINCQANAGFAMVTGTQAGYYAVVPSYPWNVQSAVWSWGDNSFSNTLYASHQYATPGNYNICLSVTVSCGATASTCANYQLVAAPGSNTVQITMQPPALLIQGLNTNAPADNNTLYVYPNPSGGIFYVILPEESPAPYTLANGIGNTLRSGVLTSADSGGAKLDLRELPAGLYFLRVYLAGKIVTRRIVLNSTMSE